MVLVGQRNVGPYMEDEDSCPKVLKILTKSLSLSSKYILKNHVQIQIIWNIFSKSINFIKSAFRQKSRLKSLVGLSQFWLSV